MRDESRKKRSEMRLGEKMACDEMQEEKILEYVIRQNAREFRDARRCKKKRHKKKIKKHKI